MHVCMRVCMYVCVHPAFSPCIFCAMHVCMPMHLWCTYDRRMCLIYCLMYCLICIIMSCILRLSYMYCLLCGCLDVCSSLSSDCDVVHASVAKQHVQVNCRPASCWQQSNEHAHHQHMKSIQSLYTNQPSAGLSQENSMSFLASVYILVAYLRTY